MKHGMRWVLLGGAGKLKMIKIEPDGDAFLLCRGDEQLRVSAKELLDLSQSAHAFRASLLEVLSPTEGLRVEALTPVSRISLDLDIHKQDLHLGLADQNNMFVHYELSLQIVELLTEKFPAYLDQMKQSQVVKRH
jgi:hypothetical protein